MKDQWEVSRLLNIEGFFHGVNNTFWHNSREYYAFVLTSYVFKSSVAAEIWFFLSQPFTKNTFHLFTVVTCSGQITSFNPSVVQNHFSPRVDLTSFLDVLGWPVGLSTWMSRLQFWNSLYYFLTYCTLIRRSPYISVRWGRHFMGKCVSYTGKGRSCQYCPFTSTYQWESIWVNYSCETAYIVGLLQVLFPADK